MIKTNWQKCDDKDCDLVAWYRAEYEEYGILKMLCQNHYEQYKEFLANWRIEQIE